MKFQFIEAHVANNGVNCQTGGPASTHQIPSYFYKIGASQKRNFQLKLKFKEDDQIVTLFLNNDFKIMPHDYEESKLSRDLIALTIKRFIEKGQISQGMFIAFNLTDGMIIYAGYDEIKAEKEADRLFTD